ncbi:amino acid ABC transporter ATP-binding protein [Sodalis sp.]|uniref:amino acid ABC transporter ATP-binding protein n=1 Tax=Sodalis sp. (in: enterobacteria) TaxID=1898979 RepID=UPI0038735BAD
MSNHATKPLLEIIGIDKYFGRNHILKNCSITVRKGETVVLIDPSGSDKSTLLRCVNLLEPVDGGSIFFANRDICGNDIEPHRLRQDIGMVFQNYELFSHLSAAENIMLAPMTVLGMSRAEARELAQELLGKVRIPDKADAFPDELSGGHPLLLYDEPTSALEPEMIREVLDVMADLSAEGMTSIVVTHEMGFAKRAASQIVFMESGEIIENASGQDFFSGTVSERARRFLDQILH